MAVSHSSRKIPYFVASGKGEFGPPLISGGAESGWNWCVSEDWLWVEGEEEADEGECDEGEGENEVEAAEFVDLKRVDTVGQQHYQNNRWRRPAFTSAEWAVNQEEGCDATGDQSTAEGVKQCHQQSRDGGRKGGGRLSQWTGPKVGRRGQEQITNPAQNHERRAGVQQADRDAAAFGRIAW
jgi:hypothetical protein